MSKDEDADDPFSLWMPAFGKIEGGRLDGYRYTFHRVVGAGAQLKIEATVTPPNWPFPKLRLLEPAGLTAVCPRSEPRPCTHCGAVHLPGCNVHCDY